MRNKSNKKFTVGISYGKHLVKAKATFQKVVFPQLLSKGKLTHTSSSTKSEKLNLSPEQKAHLNCQSPI